MKVFFRDTETGLYNDETPFLTDKALKQMKARVTNDVKDDVTEILTVLDTDLTKQHVGVPLFVIDIKAQYNEQTIKIFMEQQIPKVH